MCRDLGIVRVRLEPPWDLLMLVACGIICSKELTERLPLESKHLAATIYSNIVTQMKCRWHPEREAIVGAWRLDIQRKMVIVGVCFVPLCIVCTWFWRNVNVKKL